VAAGAVDLTPRLVAPGLRRDVDTLADLVEAVRLGLGPASAGLLADLAPAGLLPGGRGEVAGVSRGAP